MVILTMPNFEVFSFFFFFFLQAGAIPNIKVNQIIFILKSFPKLWVDYYREISSHLYSPTSCFLLFLPNLFYPSGSNPSSWSFSLLFCCVAEDIKCRLKAGNSCYYSVQTLLSSRLLSKNLKIKIYKTIILPVVL